jgi:hypothetical protein
MPGLDLNLDLPSLTDTLADVVSKTATALAAIEDDLAGLITVGELDMNAALSMEGNAITDVGGLVLTSGNPGTAGSVVYVGGEFYLVTPAGTVQITSGGALDAGSIGGITGMSGGAAVEFDLASGEFRFYEDTGVRADLVADEVVLHGANGTVLLTVDDAIASARVVNFKSLPASGVSLLAYDAADSALVDAADQTITSDMTFSGELTLATIAVTTLKHAAFSRTFPAPLLCVPGAAGVTVGNGPAPTLSVTVGNQVNLHLHPLRAGDRLTKVKITGAGSGGGSTPTVVVSRLDGDGTYATTYAHTKSLVGAYNGTFELELLITTPVVLPADSVPFVSFTPAGSTVVIRNVTVTFDQV